MIKFLYFFFICEKSFFICKKVINCFRKQFMTFYKIYIILTSLSITHGPIFSGKSTNVIASLVTGCSILNLYAQSDICFPLPRVPYF